MCDYGIIERKIYCGRIFRPRRIDAEKAESRWSRKPVTNTVCALCLGGQDRLILFYSCNSVFCPLQVFLMGKLVKKYRRVRCMSD